MRAIVPILGLLLAVLTVLSVPVAGLVAERMDSLVVDTLLVPIFAIAALNLLAAAFLVRRGPGTGLLRWLHLGASAVLVLAPVALLSLGIGFGRHDEICEIVLSPASRWLSLLLAWGLGLLGLGLLSTRRLWWLAAGMLPLALWLYDSAGTRIDPAGSVRICRALRPCRVVLPHTEPLIEIVATAERVQLVRPPPSPRLAIAPPLLGRWKEDRLDHALLQECK